MDIIVTSGTGYGKTPLSAFDSALKDAGVYNFNLIYISSIIPARSSMKLKKFKASRKQYGDRLYVVRSEIRSRESGKCIGAALGWYQLKNGKGVFVEHEEMGETEGAVESNLTAEIKKSLTDLCRARGFPYAEKRMQMKMRTVKVTDSSACTLVLAVYKAERWGDTHE